MQLLSTESHVLQNTRHSALSTRYSVLNSGVLEDKGTFGQEDYEFGSFT